MVLPSFRVDALRRAGSLLPTGALVGRPGFGSGGPDDEDYWAEIQRAFDCDRTITNLNNGGCSPTPTHVLEQMIRDLKFSNELPVINMWQTLEPRIESVRRELARSFGCDPEEMAITRNASEANETMIMGLDLKPGDEVIVTNQNYGPDAHRLGPASAAGWHRAQADLVQASPALAAVHRRSVQGGGHTAHPVIEVTHITNLSGQIMPVRELVDFARPRGIEVFVDGAHAYAHFPFTRDQLDCDYYGTSLHKWLLAPIGTGFLYVRKSKQKRLWPMMAAPTTMDENVRKYEEIGTHPAANHNAISVALAFTTPSGGSGKRPGCAICATGGPSGSPRRAIGSASWTPLDSPYSCGIGLVHVEGIEPGALAGWMFEKHKIVVTPHRSRGVQRAPHHTQCVHDSGGDRPFRGQDDRSGPQGHRVKIRAAAPADEAFILRLTEQLGAFSVPHWRSAAEIAAADHIILLDALHETGTGDQPADRRSGSREAARLRLLLDARGLLYPRAPRPTSKYWLWNPPRRDRASAAG